MLVVSILFTFLLAPADLALPHGSLDAQESVVLGHPLGAAGSARLDEGRARGHGDGWR